jgi:hypothetical protein
LSEKLQKSTQQPKDTVSIPLINTIDACIADHGLFIVIVAYQSLAVLEMTIWMDWSESNPWIYFYMVLKKTEKFTGLGPENRCSSWVLPDSFSFPKAITYLLSNIVVLNWEKLFPQINHCKYFVLFVLVAFISCSIIYSR